MKTLLAITVVLLGLFEMLLIAMFHQTIPNIDGRARIACEQADYQIAKMTGDTATVGKAESVMPPIRRNHVIDGVLVVVLCANTTVIIVILRRLRRREHRPG